MSEVPHLGSTDPGVQGPIIGWSRCSIHRLRFHCSPYFLTWHFNMTIIWPGTKTCLLHPILPAQIWTCGGPLMGECSIWCLFLLAQSLSLLSVIQPTQNLMSFTPSDTSTGLLFEPALKLNPYISFCHHGSGDAKACLWMSVPYDIFGFQLNPSWYVSPWNMISSLSLVLTECFPYILMTSSKLNKCCSRHTMVEPWVVDGPFLHLRDLFSLWVRLIRGMNIRPASWADLPSHQWAPKCSCD